jgi:N-acetylglucosaminyldiphosphoundecaprenol N-acetyl-beta-D-mannosaminyltransferase
VGKALINVRTMRDACSKIEQLVERGSIGAIVVTPNIDHVANLESNELLQAAYRRSALVSADGWPVAIAATLVSRRWHHRVAGSDLVEEMSRRAAVMGYRVAVVGGAPGAATGAAKALSERYPGLQVVHIDEAPAHLMKDSRERAGIAQRLAQAHPDVTFLGLGSPKQEIFALESLSRDVSGVVLAVGAAINFSAGLQPRAPLVLQRMGLEWLHRLAHEPRRLAPRYARSSWGFIAAILRGWQFMR